MRLLLFILGLGLNIQIYANTVCHPHYEERIKDLEKLLVPARGATINSTAGAIIAQPLLLGLGLFNPVTGIAVGAAIVGSASYYAIIQTQINQYKNVLKMYNYHDRTESKIYRRVFKRLKYNQLLMDQLIHFVKSGMEDGLFCEFDFKLDRYKLYRMKDLIKYSREKYDRIQQFKGSNRRS